MSTFGAFSYDDALEIKRRVLISSSPQKPLDGARKMLGQADKYYVRLDQNLAQATNPLTGYTQAEARPVRYVPGQDSLDMDIVEDASNPPIIVTNRSESFSASLGNVIQVHRVNSEWAPIHASGGGNSPSDTCPCFCLPSGNLIVEGVETTDVWEVAIGDLEWEVDNGYVILPRGTYTVFWDESRQLWVGDIGDSLLSYFPDGTSATLVSVLDGEITIELHPDKSSTVKVCITATIPLQQIDQGYSAGYAYGIENGNIDGLAGNPYDDRVIIAGETGTAAGTGDYQQFGTGTWLAPGTGTYGEETGTGTGTGTFQWSDYEEGFYQGYKDGYAVGYEAGINYVPGTGTGTGTYLFPSDPGI